MSLHSPSIHTALAQVIPGCHGTTRAVSGCLRGHRDTPERNCCKGRLERDISEISRLRQMHRNDQRERHPKLWMTQINNLAINSSPQANRGSWRGPTTSEGWAVSSAASPAPPGSCSAPAPVPAMEPQLWWACCCCCCPGAEFLHFCYRGRALGKDPLFT